MTAATTLCGLQGVGRRRHHRFNQEGREAEGGQRSRATRIKGVEEKAINTTEQVKQLLKSLLPDDCAMENLDLSANILSMIEPDLMAKSLIKLKVVSLLDSNISVNQVGKNIISYN